jgi:hypothetical protein
VWGLPLSWLTVTLFRYAGQHHWSGRLQAIRSGKLTTGSKAWGARGNDRVVRALPARGRFRRGRQEQLPRHALPSRPARAAWLRGLGRLLPQGAGRRRARRGTRHADRRGRPERPGVGSGRRRPGASADRLARSGRQPGRRDPDRVPGPVRALRGRRPARRGPLLGDLRGPARRELRRRARHLPVGPRRRRGRAARAPLLGQSVRPGSSCPPTASRTCTKARSWWRR